LSLGFAPKTLKKVFANHKLEDGVAEKFQTLIIKMIALHFVAQTGMRESFGQQERIPELVTNAFLDRTHVPVILSEIEESLNLLNFTADPGSASQRESKVIRARVRQAFRAIASDKPRAR
jgi:hypothetical protein